MRPYQYIGQDIFTYIFFIVCSFAFVVIFKETPDYLCWLSGFAVALFTVGRLQIILDYYDPIGLEEMLFYYDSDSSSDYSEVKDYDSYEDDIILPVEPENNDKSRKRKRSKSPTSHSSGEGTKFLGFYEKF